MKIVEGKRTWETEIRKAKLERKFNWRAVVSIER